MNELTGPFTRTAAAPLTYVGLMRCSWCKRALSECRCFSSITVVSNMKNLPDGVHLEAGVGGDNMPASAVVIIPVPAGFRHEEALIRLCNLLIPILSSGVISERELTKRIIRHHPAGEG